MKTVYFVRHGETAGNKEKFFQTATTPLSDRGREQSAYISVRVAKLGVELIIASSMDRARETAEIISRRAGVPVETSELLWERILPKEQRGNPMNDPQVKRITAEVTKHFGEPDWRFSDEETFQDLKDRAGNVLELLEKRPEKNILCVTHGIFLRILLGRVLLGNDLTPTAAADIMGSSLTTNTGLSVLWYGFKEHPGYYSSSRSGWQLLVWNDHAHLG